MLLGACRREAPSAVPPSRDAAVAPVAPGGRARAVDAGRDPCAPTFADTRVGIDDESALALACDDTLLVGWWRGQGVEVHGVTPAACGRVVDHHERVWARPRRWR